MAYIGLAPGVSSQRMEDTFTATAGQTSFVPSSGYVPGNIDVYRNGVKLANGLEFTASDGITVVLNNACAAGDSVVLLSYIPRGLSDGYTKPEADAKYTAFSSGTSMMFVQTAAPTGWTKSTAHDNKALRVVSGTAGSGGSVAFTTAFASQAVNGSIGNTTAGGSISGTVGSTTLTTTQIPSHNHEQPSPTSWGDGGNAWRFGAAGGDIVSTKNTGGGGSHNHSFSGSFSGSAHNHTFTGTAINLSVQYVDVIIATKD